MRVFSRPPTKVHGPNRETPVPTPEPLIDLLSDLEVVGSS